MEATVTKEGSSVGHVAIGDLYSFRTKIDGEQFSFVGSVVRSIGSKDARERGIIQSTRSGLVLGLSVKGVRSKQYMGLFWKQRQQCKRYIVV